MDEKEYLNLYEQLNSLDAIDRLVHNGYDRDLLFVIYTNHIIRDTKKRYYSVKKKIPELLLEWRRGASFNDLSNQLNFPPVLLASLILQQMGWNKKIIRRSLHDPRLIDDERIRSEIIASCHLDKIYSPKGNEIQHERGKDVEGYVAEWLNDQKRKYKTEKDSKEEGYPKTPDFRVEAPLKVNGKWVNWIECKGTFGDKKEIQKNYNDQLTHYVDLFGSGIVVYWYGFIEGILTDERIIVTDKEFFM